jgi:hypothetical protein
MRNSALRRTDGQMREHCAVELESQPLRGISNSLGDFRKSRNHYSANANSVTLVLVATNSPEKWRIRIPTVTALQTYLEELSQAFWAYVWNAHLLWTLSIETYEKHGASKTFPEFISRRPDMDAGSNALVFDLFNVARRDVLRLSPRVVPMKRHDSTGATTGGLDLLVSLDQLRCYRYTKHGADQYVASLTEDVSFSELYRMFNLALRDFTNWFESELRGLLFISMGR